METVKLVWLVAAGTSASTAIFIAAIMDHIPGATVVDVGALLITGVLAGLFLSLGLKSSRPSPN